MEIVLVSLYVAPNFNIFKSFIILDEYWYYFVSTLNNRITVIKSMPAYEFNGSYSDMLKDIAFKMAFNKPTTLSPRAQTFFNNNHKKMNKRYE